MGPRDGLPADWIDASGVALAGARRQASLVDLQLDRVITLEQAEAVQSAAVEAYGDASVGYSIQGTSALSRRRIHCDEPIFGPILEQDIVSSGARFRLPHGVLGAGCSFAFTVGRSYPADGEEIDGESISQAVADCRLAIEILGRRVPGAVPLNALTATADFALNVLYVEGAHLHDPAKLDLAEVRVAATIDGKTVSTGCGGDVMTHPLEAVAWLARELKRRGRELESGDLIATGTCVGILQVMPGQVFAADFGPLGRVSVSLE